MSVPVTRSLAYVLRDQLNEAGQARLAVYQVASVPDANHVTVSDQGQQFTIPRIAAYKPEVGEPALCVVADTLTVAIGSVGGIPPTEYPANPTYDQLKRGRP